MPQARLAVRALGTLLVLLTYCASARAETGVIGDPDVSDHATVAARDSAAKKNRGRRGPTVYGFIQVHYRGTLHTGADSLFDSDDFRVQRARVGVKGDLSPQVGYAVEIDPRAPEVAGILRDAYLALHVVEHHEIRIGQQKTQFGYENRESSTRLYVVNRSELSDNLSRGISLRDVGVGIIGHVNVSERVRLEDAFTLVNGAGLNVQADNTPRKNGWGRLGMRWRNRDSRRTLWVGASGGYGDLIETGDDPLDPSDDFRLVFNRYGIDTEYDSRRVFFSAEYVSGHETDKSTDESDEPQGYYLQVVWKAFGCAGPLYRIDDFDDDFHRHTFGAFWGLPSEKLRVLINYEYRQRKDFERGDDRIYLWTQARF